MHTIILTTKYSKYFKYVVLHFKWDKKHSRYMEYFFRKDDKRFATVLLDEKRKYEKE
jgi:hypothetical protein